MVVRRDPGTLGEVGVWTSAALQELLAEPVRNGVYKKKAFHGRGQKIVNMGELFANEFISNQEMRRVELSTRELTNCLVQTGDLLFARRSFVLEGAGKCSLMVAVPEPTTFESSIIRIRLKRDLACPRFYYYLFKSQIGRGLISSIAVRTAVSGITGTALAQLRVPLPPIGVQRRIASILSAYDDLIENNTRRMAILEEMARLIYREWFVNFRFPGHEQIMMADSPLGPVPEGWKIATLRDVAAEVRRPIRPQDVDAETPYVGLEHIPRRSMALSEWGRADDVGSTKHEFKAGEILFGKIRPYFHKVSVAPVDGVCSSDAIVIRPTATRFFGLALLCVSSDQFVAHAAQTSQGTKMPRANWEVLLRYPVVIPSEPVLEQFNSLVKAFVDLIQNLLFRNSNLRETRDLLLPRLISGDLDVSELDIEATQELSA